MICGSTGRAEYSNLGFQEVVCVCRSWLPPHAWPSRFLPDVYLPTSFSRSRSRVVSFFFFQHPPSFLSRLPSPRPRTGFQKKKKTPGSVVVTSEKPSRSPISSAHNAMALFFFFQSVAMVCVWIESVRTARHPVTLQPNGNTEREKKEKKNIGVYMLQSSPHAKPIRAICKPYLKGERRKTPGRGLRHAGNLHRERKAYRRISSRGGAFTLLSSAFFFGQRSPDTHVFDFFKFTSTEPGRAGYIPTPLPPPPRCGLRKVATERGRPIDISGSSEKRAFISFHHNRS